MQLLTQLADVVYFSAACPYQGGVHHVNEQPPAYWAKIFARYNYECFDILREKLWEHEAPLVQYRMNSLIFINKDRKDIIKDLLPTPNPHYIVCPELYEMKCKHIEGLLFENERLKSKLNKTFSNRMDKFYKSILYKFRKNRHK